MWSGDKLSSTSHELPSLVRFSALRVLVPPRRLALGEAPCLAGLRPNVSIPVARKAVKQ